MRRCRHLSGGVHQLHDPAAEDVPPGIAVRRHRQGARRELAPGFARIPSPFVGTHPSISRPRISPNMLRRSIKLSMSMEKRAFFLLQCTKSSHYAISPRLPSHGEVFSLRLSCLESFAPGLVDLQRDAAEKPPPGER